MKYIRTKDKLYGFIPNVVSSIEYDEEMSVYNIYYFDEDKGEHLEQDDKGGHSMDSIWDKNIVAKANTIEELCDGLIVEEKNNTWNWFVMTIIEFNELDKEERLYRVKDWNFNAFIQTDKGLIYVAKMNEKGVLELI